jgi:pimeloyl-ACP methyl ester carboxylesterase
MAKLILLQFLALFLLSASTHGAESPQTQEWEKKEMDSIGLPKTDMRKLEKLKLLPDKPSCGESDCTFDLYYFVGRGFNTGDSDRKNILYIPGGPGEIVDRQPHELEFLEQKHNVIYFDVRGTGLSLILGPNKYDRFLRARFITSDIEELRRKVIPNNKPWDAIYAHSYGTIVAQQYAKLPGPEKVKKLILSAPVSRHVDLDIEPHHEAMILSNLLNIYKHHTSNPDCKWNGVFNTLKILAADLISLWATGTSQEFLDRTNDFCFLTQGQVDEIKGKLKEHLKDFDARGSIGFVIANYNELAKGDDDFKAENPKAKYPYPERFFLALKQLELFGSPAQKSSDLPAEIKNRQVDAALIVGYYLLSDSQDAVSPKCNKRASIWKGLMKLIGVLNFGEHFCLRVEKAGDALESPKEPRSRSVRAANVLGIHDGLNRWPFRLLKVNNDCLKGKNLKDFASEASTTSKTGRDLLKRVGTDPDEPICLWNPKKYSHGIPTLILKGGADPVIAGGQAEDFIKNGVTNERVLIEFPELGHSWTAGLGAEGRKSLGTLVEKFLGLSDVQFRQQEDVKAILKDLRAVDRTPTP